MTELSSAHLAKLLSNHKTQSFPKTASSFIREVQYVSMNMTTVHIYIHPLPHLFEKPHFLKKTTALNSKRLQMAQQINIACWSAMLCRSAFWRARRIARQIQSPWQMSFWMQTHFWRIPKERKFWDQEEIARELRTRRLSLDSSTARYTLIFWNQSIWNTEARVQSTLLQWRVSQCVGPEQH